MPIDQILSLLVTSCLFKRVVAAMRWVKPTCKSVSDEPDEEPLFKPEI